MDIEKFRKTISERINIEEISVGEDYEGIEKCQQKVIDILCEDIESTIAFLNNECTADEFSWISEVFDDIAEKTQSKAFVDCIKHVSQKFPEECAKYNISGSIAFAENALLK